MAWRAKLRARGAPRGVEQAEAVLEHFEERMREVMAEDAEPKMRSELSWGVHRTHWERNRALWELSRAGTLSDDALRYLVRCKLADGALIAKWSKPGYERLCSTLVLSRKNTSFGTTGICRVPIRERQAQIMPNVQTGCVTCATEDGGPFWWNDTLPPRIMRIVRHRNPNAAVECPSDGEVGDNGEVDKPDETGERSDRGESGSSRDDVARATIEYNSDKESADNRVLRDSVPGIAVDGDDATDTLKIRELESREIAEKESEKAPMAPDEMSLPSRKASSSEASRRHTSEGQQGSMPDNCGCSEYANIVAEDGDGHRMPSSEPKANQLEAERERSETDSVKRRRITPAKESE